MEHEELIVLDEGMGPAEVAASQACCKSGPAKFQSVVEDEQ